MNKKSLIFILVILIGIIPVYAEDQGPNVAVTFIDAISKEIIEDVFIEIKLNEETKYYFLQQDETFKMNLAPGNYEVEILIDDPETDGMDYYTESYFEVRENLVKLIHLYPVGSVSGFVKDKLDNVISGADLKFECNRAFNLDYPKTTDKFGSFSLRFVPIGNCKIHGSFGGETGMTEIEIEKGSLTASEIRLNTSLIGGDNFSVLYFIPLILIIIILAGLVWLFLMKNKKEPVRKKEAIIEKKTENRLGQRGEDILKTLRKNEKKIVNYLLETKEPTHLSKIHYKTGISKGALFRNINSLEQKNVVETFKEGRVKKIRLSEWFTEK